MLKNVFPLRPPLVDATRFPLLADRHAPFDQARLREIAWLLGMGALAGIAASRLDFNLGIPGHAILRSAPFIALGMAVVPRRHAGWLLGTGSVLGLGGVQLTGGHLPGWGATTSLLLLGPAVELALGSARSGWRIYAGFALAGLAANALAFLTRATPKALGLEAGRPRGNGGPTWFSKAALSYALCGLLAGLISAAVCFRTQRRGAQLPADDE